MFVLPIDPWIKLTATTVGRDKFYRLIQYLSKFLAHYWQQQAPSDFVVDRLTKLSTAVGLARKLFRLGKPLDFLQTILKSATINDDVVRLCAVGRSASLAGWLTLDAFQWFNAHGVIKLENIKQINKNAAQFWLLGLMFAVSADLYRFRNNFQRISVLENKQLDGDLKKELAVLKSERQKILFELTQDSLDLIIPGTLLQYIPVSNGIVGLAGTITSLMGLYSAWPKSV